MAAACMTWELAESGSSFVTTVINGSDLVPCFSSASVDDLRAEVCPIPCCFSLDQKTWWFLSPNISAVLSWVFLVLLWLNTNIGLPNLLWSLGSWKQVTASAWVDDFREQIERTRILRTVYRSATALSSRLQSIASLSRATLPYSTLMVARAAQTGAAGAGAIWRPVSSGTQVPQICIVPTIMFKLSFFCFHILPTCEKLFIVPSIGYYYKNTTQGLLCILVPELLKFWKVKCETA